MPGRPHVCICVCTYKRPHFLSRLLGALVKQETEGLFSYSIVVADNDVCCSAQLTVENVRLTTTVPIQYCVEPQQGISLVRNRAVKASHGDFVALIDDDEFCAERWLVTLFKTCEASKVDGVLGPVVRHFDEAPPSWLEKGNFYKRRIYPTGTTVCWQEARTGNVLLRRQVLEQEAVPFRPEFRGGEDQDFFRRMIQKGHVFIWSDSAIAYEVVPPSRWRRDYMMRKALLRGAMTVVSPAFGARDVIKSLIAVPAYVAALPIALMVGQHKFVELLIKICDHLGKLLQLINLNPVKEPYVAG